MIFLGSSSIFRKKLLDDAGFQSTVVRPEIDETIVSGLLPSDLARERALIKGQDVCRIIQGGKEYSVRSETQVVIGCDQVLGLGDVSFDKASTVEEAFERLSNFSGKTHILYSAYALFQRRRDEERFRCVIQRVYPASMNMRSLTSEEIREYLGTNEWQGVVGCYRYEGAGRKLFANADSNESAIVGLPMNLLSQDIGGIAQN
jgi:septum formation protein